MLAANKRFTLDLDGFMALMKTGHLDSIVDVRSRFVVVSIPWLNENLGGKKGKQLLVSTHMLDPSVLVFID